MNTELQESLLDAISVVAENSVNNSKADLTIECEVVKVQDSEKGIYTVRYTENNFTAHSVNGISYAVGDSVYVLVPQGDFSKNKIIEGTTQGSEQNVISGGSGSGDTPEPTPTPAPAELQDEDYYNEISDNLLLEIDDSISLCTYHTETKNVNFNDDFISAIISNYDKFVLYADFRTDIVDLTQRANGNYGIKISIPVINNVTNEKSVVEKVIDIYNMDGNYYNFEKFATQKLFFDFDGKRYDPDEDMTVTAFVKDFYQDDSIIDPDIFIKNIGLKAVEALTEEEVNGYFLGIKATEGYYFLTNKYDNDKILTPVLRVNGASADVRDYDCYWFKEDSSIGYDSEYYSPRGGVGWRILNPRTTIVYNLEGTEEYDYNTKIYTQLVTKAEIKASARYKCVLVNSNITLHKIVTITKLDSIFTYSLTTPSGSTTFVKDVGIVNLIAKLHYPESTDNTTFDYIFKRYDKNGNYLDDNFYTRDAWDVVEGEDRITKISFLVGNIDEINTIKCEFVVKKTQDTDVRYESIGTSSITLSTGEEIFNYYLSLTNEQYLYKYDADGNAPTLANYDGPFASKIDTIEPVTVRVFKVIGDELDTSEYNAVDMTWAFPKKTMLKLLGYTQGVNYIAVSDLSQLEQDDNYYYIKGKNIMSLSYNILDRYNNEYYDNTILITAEFDNTVLKAKTIFTFMKDGEAGTNGSAYAAVITYNNYAYEQKDGNGIPQKIRLAYVVDTWKRYLNNQFLDFGTPSFGIKIYKSGKLITDHSLYNISWSILDARDTNPFFKMNNNILQVKESWTTASDVSVNIIQAKITIKETQDTIGTQDANINNVECITAYYPLDIVRLDTEQTFIPEIAGGYSQVLYKSDGTLPRYNMNKEFYANVVDGLNNFFDCEWNVSNTLKDEETSTHASDFKRRYRPIDQLYDGQNKNYVKITLEQTSAQQDQVNAEAAAAQQQIDSLTHQISYLDNEKNYLTTFLNSYSYDTFVNNLSASDSYLVYRARYLSILFGLINILDNIHDIDESLDYTEEKLAITSVIADIYNAESGSDIVSYIDTLEIGEITDYNIIGLINTFNENVAEGIRAYNNLINYNNLSTELTAYNAVVSAVQALPAAITNLCSAHDEQPANQTFVVIQEQITNYGNYFRDNSKGYTKTWICENILKAIENLLTIYRDSDYINNHYTTVKETLELDKEQQQDIVRAKGQSLFSHAIVIKPILFLLNRYSLVAANNWDGNKLYLDENGRYIIAPQMLAGKKDSQGLFTGVTMGIEGFNSDNQEIGLLGYHAGQRSIFLDAVTGNADFGVAGEGQIQMRPGGTSTIAQWKINNDSLSKTTNNGKVALYAAQDDNRNKVIGRENSYKAFEATNLLSGDDKRETYITYDGYLYTNDAHVTGWITATSGKIGGWTIHDNGLVDENQNAYIRAGNINIEYNKIYSTGKINDNGTVNSNPGFFLSKDKFLIGNSSNYLSYAAGTIAITNPSIGLTFNRNTFKVGSTLKYFEYTAAGDFTIQNSNLGLYLDNTRFKLGNSTKYLEYTAAGDFTIKHSSLGLSFTNNEFRVGQGENYMRYTAAGGLEIRGRLYADEGRIGPFQAGKSLTDGRQYIWTELNPNSTLKRNFILGAGGMCLAGFGKLYIGNNYIGPDIKIQNYSYAGGTIIHSNGGIQTDYLTIMQNSTPLKSPVTNPLINVKVPKGIYMNLSQGEFASWDGKNGNSEHYPLMLRLIGCDTDNSVIKHTYIGLWNEGRLIIGEKDYGIDKFDSTTGNPTGHYRAMKATIDGALYVNKNIYCSFGEDTEDSDYDRVYKLSKKTVTIGEESLDIIYAKHTGYCSASEGPDPVAPSGNMGGELPPPSETNPTFDPNDPVNPYTPEPDYCVKFSSDRNFTLRVGGYKWTGSMEYSLDKGQTWNTMTYSNRPTLNGTATQSIYLRGVGITSFDGGSYNSNYNYPWTFTGKKISGNIETLLDYTKVQNNEHPVMESYCFSCMFKNCTSLVEAFDELPAPILANCCYDGMFSGCTSLRKAPELPSIALADYCYRGMFDKCASLTTAPELPATTLKRYCYAYMFNKCTLLTITPELPATTLVEYCYDSMFYGCTSLIATPELPATTLASYCYNFMFSECTSLITAPGLPATTLAGYCYSYMFKGCTSLTAAPELPATTLTGCCYRGMFEGCTSLINAPELPATTLADSCYYLMFQNCTSLIATPELPATTLASYCYGNMFSGCTSLIEIPDFSHINAASSHSMGNMFAKCTSLEHINLTLRSMNEGTCALMFEKCTSLKTAIISDIEPTYCTGSYWYSGIFKNCSALTAADLLPKKLCPYCYQGAFEGCISLIRTVNIEAIKLDSNCFSSMFKDCISLESCPILPITTLAYQCYSNMFKGCTSLITAPELPATTLVENCYEYMFSGCTSLREAPELPATTLASSCYYYMFNGCTSLITAPELPATILASSCYCYMFSECTSLINAPELPATTLANSCYSHMFHRCTSLREAPELPTTTLAKYCYYYMFNECTSLINAPELPATTLAECCYSYMFYRCTSLREAPNILATTIAVESCSYMFENCTSLMDVPDFNSFRVVGEKGCYYMFHHCTSLRKAPELPAKIINSACYYCMFDGCTSLITAPELPATTSADACYEYMFSGCTSLINAPELPAITLANNCYEYMFDGCTSLITAPELPATTLADACYSHMFHRCTSLREAPELPATTLAKYCYYHMFDECTSIKTLPNLPATTLAEYCYHSMFIRCLGIALSTTQNDVYQIPFRLPTEGTISSTPSNALVSMFYGTGGLYKGGAVANTTYYLAQ